MITVADICNRLGVTEIAVGVAIYSGRLPNPTLDGSWSELHIEPFLANWENFLKTKHKKLSTSCVKPGFPIHTR